MGPVACKADSLLFQLGTLYLQTGTIMVRRVVLNTMIGLVEQEARGIGYGAGVSSSSTPALLAVPG